MVSHITCQFSIVVKEASLYFQLFILLNLLASEFLVFFISSCCVGPPHDTTPLFFAFFSVRCKLNFEVLMAFYGGGSAPATGLYGGKSTPTTGHYGGVGKAAPSGFLFFLFVDYNISFLYCGLLW